MRPVLLVRNDPEETFGLAMRSLVDAGATVRAHDATDPANALPPLEDVAGVVMLGGTMNVDEVDAHPYLLGDRALAREAVDQAVPYLGICLGAQILARALNREVTPAPVKEIGYEPIRPTPAAPEDPVLAHYGGGDMVFHWHQDTFELPERAVLLAAGDRVPNQAYRVGPSAWGVQFHLEIDAAEVERWLDDAERSGDLGADWGKSAATIREEAARFQARHETLGAEVFRRFARVVREQEG